MLVKETVCGKLNGYTPFKNRRGKMKKKCLLKEFQGLYFDHSHKEQ
jgi:uncharacterized protein YggL (DUF469 family)